MSFEGKVALVTGGSSGIGLGIAKELASLGAKVIITGRQDAKLDAAVKEIGGDTKGIKADVSNLQELDTLYAAIKSEYSTLDILVANAGFGILAPLGAITEEQYDSIFDTNLKGVIFTVQKALPLMGSGGAVVLIGSTASIQPGTMMSVYGATKAGLRNLARSWIDDIRGSGIRINVVSPGPVRTQSLYDFFPEEKRDEILAHLETKSTVGRLGQPKDIAKAVAFLASEDAGYINGVELIVDGGASQI
ncbi:SDR family oxidoreductase [Neorhizobium sp. JUb45]|uniref:SDR family NAD(P)-dependent oxidoreductase n=1 Tax=unclassified Neorhizobium TaxID=2629175 RepID=UPI00104CA961|nr:SDR family oxidoreductase [Neorhizobium sp. JUb45]TCQ97166.1 NAD(P)-dependent dehydrogenase (short-subunit alcohol dehydrogenase family) [Neorhizobium sp. JUb45]